MIVEGWLALREIGIYVKFTEASCADATSSLASYPSRSSISWGRTGSVAMPNQDS